MSFISDIINGGLSFLFINIDVLVTEKVFAQILFCNLLTLNLNLVSFEYLGIFIWQSIVIHFFSDFSSYFHLKILDTSTFLI